MGDFEIAIGVEGLSRRAFPGIERQELKETRILGLRPKPEAETVYDSIVKLAAEDEIEVDLISLEDSVEILFENADAEKDDSEDDDTELDDTEEYDRHKLNLLIGRVTQAIVEFNPSNTVEVLPDEVKLRDQRSVFAHIPKAA